MKLYTYHESLVGQLLIAGTRDAVTEIWFPTETGLNALQDEWQRDDAAFATVTTQLSEYFAGERTQFSVQIDLAGSDFQKKVWGVLQDIPYGTTISYGETAKRMGNPKASRAVGGANNANPIPIIVPCHRVIGADSSMTGFGGGLNIKKALLALEYRFNAPANDQRDLFYENET